MSRTWPHEPTTPPSPPERLGHCGSALTCCHLLPPPPSETALSTLRTRGTHCVMAERISPAKVGLKNSQIEGPKDLIFRYIFLQRTGTTWKSSWSCGYIRALPCVLSAWKYNARGPRREWFLNELPALRQRSMRPCSEWGRQVNEAVSGEVMWMKGRRSLAYCGRLMDAK